MSDYRTAESIARRHMHKGDRLIRQKLKEAGIDDLCAGQAVAELGDELLRAKEAALKKQALIKADSPQQREQKLIRFLSSRGFKPDTCYRVAKKLL